MLMLSAQVCQTGRQLHRQEGPKRADFSGFLLFEVIYIFKMDAQFLQQTNRQMQLSHEGANPHPPTSLFARSHHVYVVVINTNDQLTLVITQ